MGLNTISQEVFKVSYRRKYNVFSQISTFTFKSCGISMLQLRGQIHSPLFLLYPYFYSVDQT